MDIIAPSQNISPPCFSPYDATGLTSSLLKFTQRVLGYVSLRWNGKYGLRVCPSRMCASPFMVKPLSFSYANAAAAVRVARGYRSLENTKSLQDDSTSDTQVGEEPLPTGSCLLSLHTASPRPRVYFSQGKRESSVVTASLVHLLVAVVRGSKQNASA